MQPNGKRAGTEVISETPALQPSASHRLGYRVELVLSAVPEPVIRLCEEWLATRARSPWTTSVEQSHKVREDAVQRFELRRCEASGGFEQIVVEVREVPCPDHDVIVRIARFDAGSRMPRGHPAATESVRPPTLPRLLISRFPAHRQGEVILQPRVCDYAGVDELADFIRDPERTIPLVVISPSWSGPLTNPVQLAQTLAGHAHVHVLATRRAAASLSQELGAGQDCQNGAVNLYGPDHPADGSRKSWPPDFSALGAPRFRLFVLAEILDRWPVPFELEER